MICDSASVASGVTEIMGIDERLRKISISDQIVTPTKDPLILDFHRHKEISTKRNYSHSSCWSRNDNDDNFNDIDNSCNDSDSNIVIKVIEGARNETCRHCTESVIVNNNLNCQRQEMIERKSGIGSQRGHNDHIPSSDCESNAENTTKMGFRNSPIVDIRHLQEKTASERKLDNGPRKSYPDSSNYNDNYLINASESNASSENNAKMGFSNSYIVDYYQPQEEMVSEKKRDRGPPRSYLDSGNYNDNNLISASESNASSENNAKTGFSNSYIVDYHHLQKESVSENKRDNGPPRSYLDSGNYNDKNLISASESYARLENNAKSGFSNSYILDYHQPQKESVSEKKRDNGPPRSYLQSDGNYNDNFIWSGESNANLGNTAEMRFRYSHITDYRHPQKEIVSEKKRDNGPPRNYLDNGNYNDNNLINASESNASLKNTTKMGFSNSNILDYHQPQKESVSEKKRDNGPPRSYLHSDGNYNDNFIWSVESNANLGNTAEMRFRNSHRTDYRHPQKESVSGRKSNNGPPKRYLHHDDKNDNTVIRDSGINSKMGNTIVNYRSHPKKGVKVNVSVNVPQRQTFDRGNYNDNLVNVDGESINSETFAVFRSCLKGLTQVCDDNIAIDDNDPESDNRETIARLRRFREELEVKFNELMLTRGGTPSDRDVIVLSIDTRRHKQNSCFEMTRESPLESPGLRRRNIDLINFNSSHEIPSQILQLKEQQHLQQQILFQSFQLEQQRLAQRHDEQLKQRLEEWYAQQQQKAREEEDRKRLESLKKKDKHEESGNASAEVKRKLHGFVLNRLKSSVASNGISGSSPQGYHSCSVLPSPSPDSSTSTNAVGSTPHQLNPVPGKSDKTFPLRKTASDSNISKTRPKQQHRFRPVPPGTEWRQFHPRKKPHISMNNNPESGPNSPPVILSSSHVSPVAHNTPIAEENEPSYGKLTVGEQNGSSSDIASLYSSPSMPNISLGRPPTSSESSRLATVSEAEVRAACAAKLGFPLTENVLSGTIPYFPVLHLSAIDNDFHNSSSPINVHKQMQSLEQSIPYPILYQTTQHITDSQVAQARLLKQGHRTLGRTQSAPLPLGHPTLAPTGSLGVHYEDHSQQEQAHNFAKQQIRQTVFRRAGSRMQSQLSESLENDAAEVIDLTDKKCDSGNSNVEIGRQRREREALLHQQQQRDLLMRHTSLQVSEGSAFSPRSSRPLSRTQSSPLVALANETSTSLISVFTSPKLPRPLPVMKYKGEARLNLLFQFIAKNSLDDRVVRTSSGLKTGLGSDSAMLKHGCTCGGNSEHLEHGGRLQSVLARLNEKGLSQQCDKLRSRKATLEELQSCHSEPHTLLFGSNSISRQKLDVSQLSQLPMKSFVRLPCGGVGVDSDTTWNDLHTASAARMAVGCVVDLASKTWTGDIKNGFAVVRPPGHHAEESQAMGFCFFNSVAIAATLLLRQNPDPPRRILIVDWDVHHGNGTQKMFYKDNRVLYLSIHRHDDGNFFPGTGGPTECGAESGSGYTVNVAWSGGLNPPIGDAEYMAAFRSVVMPIAKAFAPDVILVSAGFDAAMGHPPNLGGYEVSPACFGWMTQQLMQLADGKVVLALEGGYDLAAICDSAEECLRALLGDKPSPIRKEELHRRPCQNAVDTLQKTIAIQLSHWPDLRQITTHTISCSAFEATQSEEIETVSALASLSMNKQHSNHIRSSHASRDTSVEPMEEDDELIINKS